MQFRVGKLTKIEHRFSVEVLSEILNYDCIV